jgi:L-proline amide hydrolase
MSAAPVNEGFAAFAVPGVDKPCQTWSKVVGNLEGRTRKVLILLHGGPGIPSTYFSSLSVLTEKYYIPVVIYDQIGCGNSTRLPEKKGDEAFWTVELFIDELNNLTAHLGIDSYDLLGHSWGGMLASAHAVQRPKALNKLILASSPASMKLWIEAQADWRSKLPKEQRDILDKHEKEGTTEDKEYVAAVEGYYARHVCRLPVWPAELLESLGALESDNTVYLTM